MTRRRNKSELHWKIDKASKVIKVAQEKFGDGLAIAWTGGKDSTVLLHLFKEINKGQVPYKIVYLDTGQEFDEIKDFVKKIAQSWKLDLRKEGLTPKMLKDYLAIKSKEEKGEGIRRLKIDLIETVVKKYKIKALSVGIRWDEHPARSSEAYFSSRETPNHIRVHPILHFTEDDVWEYIKKYRVPYVSLYDKGYRSLGEKDFTKPVKGKNLHERAGREKDKEGIMSRLRALGYF